MKLPAKPFRKKYIYLDNAASTALDPRVFFEMKPWLTTKYANPSALYSFGVEAKKAIKEARNIISEILFTQPDTLFFTSGGTESNNLAILGVARAHAHKGKHIITTRIEHSAVLEPMKHLEKEGFEITYLDVDVHGKINIKECKEVLRKDTILVSIMYVQNEIGTIYPIADIGREILKWRKEQKTEYPYFHTDACQGSTHQDLNVEKLHVDLMSVNGTKMYGPKGIGMLYKRRDVNIEPLMHGGGQESGVRSGTENVSGIVGLAKAFLLAQTEKNNDEIKLLRNYFWECIESKIAHVKLNGPALDDEARSAFNLNVSFAGLDAEALVLYLSEYGIMCSKGSACETDKEASHVLTAIKCSQEEIQGAIRFTLGKKTTKKEIMHVMKYLPGIVASLRETNQ